jgi:hypothetical protein
MLITGYFGSSAYRYGCSGFVSGVAPLHRVMKFGLVQLQISCRSRGEALKALTKSMLVRTCWMGNLPNRIHDGEQLDGTTVSCQLVIDVVLQHRRLLSTKLVLEDLYFYAAKSSKD